MASLGNPYEGFASNSLVEPSKNCADILQSCSSQTSVSKQLSHRNSAVDTNENLSETTENVEITTDCVSPASTSIHAPWNILENISAIGLSFHIDDVTQTDSPLVERFTIDDHKLSTQDSDHIPHRRFHKWITNLQRRALQSRKLASVDKGLVPHEGNVQHPDKDRCISGHKKSMSDSSLGFVTAVKSASVSLASFSMAPRSRKAGRSSRYQRTEHGSRNSNTGARLSEDGSCLAKHVIIDEAVHARSVQRRQILEEIVRTEEGYVADIKFLMNVYGTLLVSMPTMSPNLRISINQNLNEIIELHEEILEKLHRIVPHSGHHELKNTRNLAPTADTENGSSKNATGDSSWMQKIPGMTAEAPLAAEVAKVFGQKMNRFFAYEEYGAKYEMMVKDVAQTPRTIPQWEDYQKGLEALASSLSSINDQEERSRKALTVGDLLVKPIQRVCRYPLMFAELLKQTPVCDCPDSHMEIDKVLMRLRETTAEINRATDDPRIKTIMEKTWILQDRLLLNDQVDLHLKNTLRSIGRIHLCGVLHVTWQVRDGVNGQYMISLLYRDCLVLASAEKAAQMYNIHAIISLTDVRVENTDNGRGLQCHTAPFSWKLVFEGDHQLYEIMLSACSPKEELEWRSRLTERFFRDHNGGHDNPLFTILYLDIKPLGTIFGKPGTIARRVSIHRATTIGQKSSLCQVILKNTTGSQDVSQSTSSTSMNRSQSLLTTNRVPVLAPPRAERVRLENLLSDVWTREILPFPGIGARKRSEHLVRASASSMIHKLSVASITSNFTKRSTSYVSLAGHHQPAKEKYDVDKTTHTEGGESIILEKCSTSESDDTPPSCLSIIQDENLPYDEKTVSVTSTADDNSPVGTLRRLVALRAKSGWQPNGARIITPPLRTSSANSVNQIPRTPLSESPCEGDENKPQSKSGLWAKAAGMNRIVYADGIRNFFR